MLRGMYYLRVEVDFGYRGEYWVFKEDLKECIEHIFKYERGEFVSVGVWTIKKSLYGYLMEDGFIRTYWKREGICDSLEHLS